jgi:hypothetical protein
MESGNRKEKYYFKIPAVGFGTGLIVSEASENISDTAFRSLLHFCASKAREGGKPYIRINMHNQSALAERVVALGVPRSMTYAWQIKVPDTIRFLRKLQPLLERRLAESTFREFSGIFRISFYSGSIDLKWDDGRLVSVEKGGEGECGHTFCISEDLFPSLLLGHRSWEELQYFRPEVSPELLYIRPTAESLQDQTGALTATLFPARRSWICQPY